MIKHFLFVPIFHGAILSAYRATWRGNCEFERMWREASMASRCLSEQGEEKNGKTLKGNLCAGRDANRTPLQNKSREVPLSQALR